MNAHSERLKPSSTRRALASLGVHPCRLAIRLRRLSLSLGRRMLMTADRFFLMFTSLVTIVSIVAYCGVGFRGFLIDWSGVHLFRNSHSSLCKTKTIAAMMLLSRFSFYADPFRWRHLWQPGPQDLSR